MKKTLIALAAVAAATGAMAQSTVTISGSLDFAAAANTKTTSQTGTSAATDTKTSGTGVLNQWTTNQISIQGTEDLGGGLRASFVVNTGVSGNAAGSANATNNSLGNRDVNLALAGSFGTVRVGRFVPAAAVGYHSLSGAASTAIGSLYAMTSATASSAGLRFATTADSATSTGFAAGSMERNNNQIQYTSPNFNGVTVNVNYGTAKSDASGTAGQQLAKQQGISVTYAAGPLTVGLGTNKRKLQGTDTTVAADGTVTAGVDNNTRIKGDLDYVGASYNFGVATVFATQVSRKDSTDATTNADIKVNSIGVSVPMGAFTINANTYSGKNKRSSLGTDDVKLSGHQISVRYALSKRTTVYALMGEAESKRDGGNTAGNARKEKGSMIGLLHTF